MSSTITSRSADQINKRSRSPKPLNKRSITLYLGVLGLHLIAIWFLGVTPVTITKVALLPMLYGLCLLINKSLPLGWTIAILFSWIGDILLLPQWGGQTFFLAGMGAFLIAQLSYCKLLIERGAKLSFLAIGLIAAIVAGVEFGLASTSSDIGLRIGIGVYGTALLAMMMLALSLKQRFTNPIKIGATLFVLSDSLIALRMFVLADNAPTLMSLSVMLTYGLAQLYLAWILVHKVQLTVEETL